MWVTVAVNLCLKCFQPLVNCVENVQWSPQVTVQQEHFRIIGPLWFLYWPESPGRTGRAPAGGGRLPRGAAGPGADPEGRCSDWAGPTRPPPGWSGDTPPPPAATRRQHAWSRRHMDILNVCVCVCVCVCCWPALWSQPRPPCAPSWETCWWRWAAPDRRVSDTTSEVSSRFSLKEKSARSIFLTSDLNSHIFVMSAFTGSNKKFPYLCSTAAPSPWHTSCPSPSGYEPSRCSHCPEATSPATGKLHGSYPPGTTLWSEGGIEFYSFLVNYRMCRTWSTK